MADRDLVVICITYILLLCSRFSLLRNKTVKTDPKLFFLRSRGSLRRQTTGLLPLLGENPFHARLALSTRVAIETCLGKHY